MNKVTYMKKPLKQPYKQFFGTMANQVRIDIISQLMEKHTNVTTLVERTGHEQSTISHSLKRLETCGFVTVEKSGKERIYFLNKKTILPLFNLMNEHMNKYCEHVIKCQHKK